MNKIPTAEEFLIQNNDQDFRLSMSGLNISDMMIEFAKLHVKAALKAAANEANMLGETQHNNNAPDKTTDFVYVVDNNGPDYGYTVNKESILNAYPENLIL